MKFSCFLFYRDVGSEYVYVVPPWQLLRSTATGLVWCVLLGECRGRESAVKYRQVFVTGNDGWGSGIGKIGGWLVLEKM